MQRLVEPPYDLHLRERARRFEFGNAPDRLAILELGQEAVEIERAVVKYSDVVHRVCLHPLPAAIGLSRWLPREASAQVQRAYERAVRRWSASAFWRQKAHLLLSHALHNAMDDNGFLTAPVLGLMSPEVDPQGRRSALKSRRGGRSRHEGINDEGRRDGGRAGRIDRRRATAACTLPPAVSMKPHAARKPLREIAAARRKDRHNEHIPARRATPFMLSRRISCPPCLCLDAA